MQTTMTGPEAAGNEVAPAAGQGSEGQVEKLVDQQCTPTPRRNQDGDLVGCSWFYDGCGCELCETVDVQRKAEILGEQSEDVCAACGLRFAAGWIDLCNACIGEIEAMTGARIQPEPEDPRATLPLPI